MVLNSIKFSNCYLKPITSLFELSKSFGEYFETQEYFEYFEEHFETLQQKSIFLKKEMQQKEMTIKKIQ